MSGKQKKLLVRIIAAALISVAAQTLLRGEALGQILIAAAYLLVGLEVLCSAAGNILRGQIFDEKFLMSIATVGAFAIGEYMEAVAVMLFYQLGELFQSIAVGKSRKSIASLMDIRADYAVVLRDGKEQKLSPEEVEVGETLIVRVGEKVPLDGVVTEGRTTVNASALTGESLPESKEEGDKIVSGAVNLSGVVKVRVSGRYEESTVAKILELVENSAEKKAHAENFITRFARLYTPCVVAGALLLCLVPPLLFAQPWNEWINRALVFLVVSCPCALVVSVPMSFFGAIGGASRKGILIKGASYLEILAKTDTVVFDKTGTITKGSFKVNAIHPSNISEDTLLDIAATAETYSNHPVAESLIATHKGHIERSRIHTVSEISGMGIKAIVDSETYYVGNGALMEKIGAVWHECRLPGTVIHIANNKEYLGHITISDEVKDCAREAILRLKALGITKTVMLTGDIKKTAEVVGREVGVDEICSELLPAQKVEVVEELLSQGRKTVFVGDGINDAPVLARADVGIAMGALGSDAAIESADIVLMDDELLKIAEAIKISRKTMRIVKENIWFALLVKALILALGALGAANMWIAVFGDVGVMVIAILNAMRVMIK
ncbi:MAG: heavy metal translocating P-type ATPase [Clostridia bacterium]|nr:heavy metal translocating P-type ATPase [Clostridia bacterium]